MNKTFFLILGILLVLPLIVAQTYQKETIIDLKIPFEVNGSVASSSATCNISINYPNGTYLKENVSMTNRDNGDFNITLIATETSQLGGYEWRAFCCDGTNCAVGYGNFLITPTGEILTTAKGLVYILLTVLIFFLFLFVLYVNIALPMKNEKDNRGQTIKIIKKKYIKIALIPVTYSLFVWFLNLLLSVSNNLTGKFNIYYNLISFFFLFFLRLSWVVWIVCLVWFMFSWIRDLNWNKQIQKFGKVIK